MTEYTNKLNFPQYIVDWLENDNYDHNSDPYTISATTLMKPTRVHLLSTRHSGELVSDVADLVASRVGSAIHDSIEVIETPNIHKENRAFRDIQVGSVTYKISGKYDILEEHKNELFTLRDIKTTSVWAVVLNSKGEGKKDEEYRKQLSVYRWLLSTEKTVNDSAFIDFFFTDWQGAKAKQSLRSREYPLYPQQRIMPGYKIELMSLEETEKWIISRLELIEEYKNQSDEKLLPCTKTELWATDEKYAVTKPGAKRATKLCDSKVEAEDYIKIKDIKANIQIRKPVVKRCNYCSALPFCNQGQSYSKQGMLA